MCPHNKLAILYFSRDARHEGGQKQWFGKSGDSRNREVATALISHSLKAVQASGLPVYRSHEGNQRGNTFGERLANAYEELFNLGYTGVVGVGNDTPELSSINWKEVTTPLQEGQCVLGASLRGGAYLIGITAAAFSKDNFKTLPWQTSSLFQSLQKFCSQGDMQPHLLPALRDVNTFHDLLAIVNIKGIDRSLSRSISRILSQGKFVYSFFCNPTPSPFVSRLSLRGPPACA